MENKLKIILTGAMGLLILVGIGIKKIMDQKENITDANAVLSLEDTIANNTIWCGTFNLIWNDLKELAGGDIVFQNQLEIVDNLNKGTFTTKELNENSYYKIVDTPSLELKHRIEEAIKEKFNETSELLDYFNWENYDSEDYFLYAMLKKEFEFEQEFTELKKDTFKDTKEIHYFGIDSTTKDSVRNQVEVLYYKDQDYFAIKLNTKTEDEIILTRGITETSFQGIYNSLLEESKSYKGSKTFGEEDTLKIPNLNFKVKKQFTELENKELTFTNGKKYYIDKALQTIQFELNKKGGKVKSEAGMGLQKSSLKDSENPRYFHFDNTFTLFLKEKEKNLPYLAIQIDDINKFV